MRGRYTVYCEYTDPAGNVIFSETYPVTIAGGEEFGQLLIEGVELPAAADPVIIRFQRG